MFLYPMSNEQKRLFINLAMKAAESNGIVDVSQKMLLEGYSAEMGCEFVIDDHMEMNYIVSELVKISDSETINKILFEIVGMIMADGICDESEKKFLVNLCKEFNVSQTVLDEMFECLQDYKEACNRIFKLMKK